MRRRLVMAALAGTAVVGSVVPALAQTSAPVGVSQTSSGTTVYVGRAGVFVGNDGEVCPLVSTQTWQCVDPNALP